METLYTLVFSLPFYKKIFEIILDSEEFQWWYKDFTPALHPNINIFLNHSNQNQCQFHWYSTINYQSYSHSPGFSTSVLFLFQDPIQDLRLHLVVMPISLLQSLLVFHDLDTLGDEVYVLCRKALNLGLSVVFSWLDWGCGFWRRNTTDGSVHRHVLSGVGGINSSR